MPLPGKEIPWELAELRKEGLLGKTIVLIPSKDKIWSVNSQDISAFWKELERNGFHFPLPQLGCLNRLFSVDRFLDSRCQSRCCSAWWRRVFKESVSSRESQLRPIGFFISI